MSVCIGFCITICFHSSTRRFVVGLFVCFSCCLFVGQSKLDSSMIDSMMVDDEKKNGWWLA